MNRPGEKITLRPAGSEDTEFLFELFASTRRAELVNIGWNAAQIDGFLRMQFDTRERAYAMQFPNAERSVIIFGERPAGRMIVDRGESALTLTDIAVSHEFMGNGIATGLIFQLQSEAAASNRTVVLHVDRANKPAFKLYKKLGFKVTGETDFSFEMCWIAN